MPAPLWEIKVQRRIEEFPKFVYQETKPITGWQMADAAWDEREVPAPGTKELQPFTIGDRWGGPDVWKWFFGKVEVPQEWVGKKVALYLHFGRRGEWDATASEALLYVNGKPLAGLDTNHQEVVLPAQLVEARNLDLAVKAFTGMNGRNGVFQKAELVLINPVAEEFYYLLRNAARGLTTLEKDSPLYIQVSGIIEEALNTIDYRKPKSVQFYASVEEALAKLKNGLDAIPADPNRPVVVGVGHSHIDVAWLWRLLHTREKCPRTFSTALHLMDQYPEFVFIQSQAQLYEFIKQDYPEIYERIKEKIKAGQWEVNGGMWVEADCNVTSGESLVRQFLFGNRFFEKEFGVKSNVLWLPDVFGYSWALPQIIKKSGLDYFMTIKISWSQYNRFPYDTFRWRGIDGTEVLAHYITTKNNQADRAYTYNGLTDSDIIAHTWTNYQQKDVNRFLLSAYGHGDGGGGVTKGMLENGRAMKHLNFLPEWRTGKAGEFFKELDERVGNDPKLPTWHGELYLEYHRGTYTSQAQQKRKNRKSEFLMHNAELFATMAHALLDSYTYPQDKINDAWKLILTNQFHDIIPGTSIHEVYVDSKEQYEEVKRLGTSVLEEAQAALVANMDVKKGEVVIFNPLSWDRSDLVTMDWNDIFDGAEVVDDNGNRAAVQKTTIDGCDKAVFWVENVPASGYKVLRLEKTAAAPATTMQVSTTGMENDFFKLEFDELGRLSRVFDKRYDREVLAPGAVGNEFIAFEDKPLDWDCWDIDVFYQDKPYPVQDFLGAEVVEYGTERAAVKLSWKFMDSIISQRVVLYRNIPRIDFETEVDWHEHQTLLKVAFPVNVYSSKATYEIQFGNVERPTHWNTSWDMARFEVVGHKWVDLSQRDYGVSLLNDCKYGHDIKDNVIRLTLIKSGINPDPQADQGRHVFTYSLYPHAGTWFEGGTVQQAYSLNNPLLAKMADADGSGKLGREYSFVPATGDGVVLETVKKAEDSDDIILRFYEYGGGNATAVVKPNVAVEDLAETNLMEAVVAENIGDTVCLTPYEIKTIKARIKR